MSDLKTTTTKKSPKEFIQSIEHPTRQQDSLILLECFSRITGEPAVMWGTAIIGYGSYHYVYASGREGDWMKTGFSPRKNYISVYLMNGFSRFDELLSKLGKHKHGKSCLNINKLADVDMDVLEELISESYRCMSEKYD
ncbi:MAG: DUF1801 domain-containing protein [Kangiellaceae bacterium]